MADHDDKSRIQEKKQHHWLIYVAALLAGFLLVADAANFGPATKITARLGIGLLYTAFAFIVGGARSSAYISATLLWVAIALAIFL
jgi:hypothetical protein